MRGWISMQGRSSYLIASYIVVFSILTVNSPVLEARGDQISAVDKTRIEESIGGHPLCFLENLGQQHEEVAYYILGSAKTLYFTSGGVTFALSGKEEPGASNSSAANQRWAVKLDFVGADPEVRPRGEDRQDTVFSFFKGDPGDWKTGLSAYGKLVYEDLWPGIDLVYSGEGHQLKYEFVVKPHADPDQIRLTYRGATEVAVQETGSLRVRTPVHVFEDGCPYAYQETDGQRAEVSMAYALDEDSADSVFTYGFDVGEYDPRKPLVLDPVFMIYCGYIGGLSFEAGFGIAVENSGSSYVTGYTKSTELEGFPVTSGPYTVHGGLTDAFVAKVAASGSGLIYCGFIGGSENDYGYSIAVDGSSQAYVVGTTESAETDGFPVLGGPDTSHNGGRDAFVAKLSVDGTSLDYCGYIGGTENDEGRGIALSSFGHAFVTGSTFSDDTSFPVMVGPDLGYNTNGDAFVAKVKVSGDDLVYCGYIGGTNSEDGKDIAVDAFGNAYVVGITWSTALENFPVLVGPDLVQNGVLDSFVAKVNAAGTALVYCGYIGGSETDYGQGIALDSSGSAYITGWTYSSEGDGFPVVVGPDLTYNGAGDAYVAKVAPDGASLVYSGYVGGFSFDEGAGIGLDLWNRAYIAGSSASPDLPVVDGPDLTYNTNGDGFIASVSPSGDTVLDCGYLGGTSWEKTNDIAVSPGAVVAVTGQTYSTEAMGFPVLNGPDLSHNGGTEDAYVATFRYWNAYTIIVAPVPWNQKFKAIRSKWSSQPNFQ